MSPDLKTAEPRRAPRLLLVHGMGCDQSIWSFWVDRLVTQHGFHVQTLNLPGRSETRAEAAEIGQQDLASYAASVEACAQSIYEADGVWPILVGHSLGGLLAQLVAAKQPASALVLITTATPARIWGVAGSVLACFPFNPLTVFGWPGTLWLRCEGLLQHALQELSAHEKDSALEMVKRIPESRRAAWQIAFWFIDWRRGSWYEFKKIECPVLIVTGGRDGLTPPLAARSLSKHLRHTPLIKYVEYPNHSHWLIREPGWERICDDAAAWIKTLD